MASPVRRRSRRIVALVLTLATVVVAVGVSASTSTAAPKAKTTIVLWEAGGPLYIKAIRPVIRAYQKVYPDVSVIVQPVDWSTFQQRVLSAAAADQLPCVMYGNSQVASAIADANVMTPVPTSIISKKQLAEYGPGFTGGLRSSSGQLLFVPFLGGANQFYIRSDTPAGKKIPRTYSEWIAWGKKAVTYDGSGNIDREGIGWRFAPQIPGVLTSQFASMVMAAGGQFMDGANGPNAKNALFNSPAGLRVLQFMHDTIYKYRISNPPSKQTYNQSMPVLGFLGGKQASDYLGGWLPNALATLAKGPYAKIAKVWNATNTAPQPDKGGKNVAMISTDGWGVPRACDKQTLAWNFIKFMTAQQSYITFFKVYQHPVAHLGAMKSAAVKKLLTTSYPAAGNELDLWTNPVISKASVAEIHHTSNADIFKVIEDGIRKAMDDPNADLSKALSGMASDVNSILARKR